MNPKEATHSIAHQRMRDMNHYGTAAHPDGLVPWRPERPPSLEHYHRTSGRLRGCGYCGSMHPADVAAAIRAGARGSWADRKYGWPHKAYFDNVPNPFKGMPESRSSCSHPSAEEVAAGKWVQVPGDFVVVDQATGRSERQMHWCEAPKPAGPFEHGKFYTVHLLDATPEDRELIERHLGLRFHFDDAGDVRWEPVPSELRGIA